MASLLVDERGLKVWMATLVAVLVQQGLVRGSSQGETLLSLKDSLRTAVPTAYFTDWTDANGNFCSWTGVTCNRAGDVANLSLIGWQLTGTLPASIGDLSSLMHLDVSHNPNLGGTIPPEIGKLTNLYWLSFYQTGVGGTMIPELGSLINMAWLFLSGSNFTGYLPAEIGSMKSLYYLDLDNNTFSGPVPPVLGTLKNLTQL